MPATLNTPRRIRLLWFWLAVSAFLFCVWQIWNFSRPYGAGEIFGWFAAVPAERVAGAVFFAALSYLTLTGYDFIAIRYAGHRPSYGRVALASFVSISVGYPLGPAPLGTGAVRYFYYSRMGLDLEAFLKAALLIMVTALLGKFSFAGLVLLFDATTASRWSGLGRHIIVAAAVLALSGVMAYLVLCAVWRRELRVGRWTFSLPGLRVACAQAAIGTANYFFLAACLHQLVGATAPVAYAAVAVCYVFANFAVLLTHVPGGWGVLEFMILSFFPQVETLGAVIAFRAIYYLLPLALGIIVLLISEGRRGFVLLKSAAVPAPVVRSPRVP